MCIKTSHETRGRELLERALFEVIYGAGLRISGATRTNSLAGDADWKLQKHTFEVPQDNLPVVLILELRARAGSALFDASSLKLVRSRP